jgi:hypothetical protein
VPTAVAEGRADGESREGAEGRAENRGNVLLPEFECSSRGFRSLTPKISLVLPSRGHRGPFARRKNKTEATTDVLRAHVQR